MTDKDLVPSKIDYEQCVIALGATESEAVSLKGTTLVGFFTPDTFTGTGVSFLASFNGEDFLPVMDGEGALVTRDCAADQYIALDPTTLAGVNMLKVKSNDTEAAERTLTLALMDLS